MLKFYLLEVCEYVGGAVASCWKNLQNNFDLWPTNARYEIQRELRRRQGFIL